MANGCVALTHCARALGRASTHLAASSASCSPVTTCASSCRPSHTNSEARMEGWVEGMGGCMNG